MDFTVVNGRDAEHLPFDRATVACGYLRAHIEAAAWRQAILSPYLACMRVLPGRSHAAWPSLLRV